MHAAEMTLPLITAAALRCSAVHTMTMLNMAKSKTTKTRFQNFEKKELFFYAINLSRFLLQFSFISFPVFILQRLI